MCSKAPIMFATDEIECFLKKEKCQRTFTNYVFIPYTYINITFLEHIFTSWLFIH